MCIQKLWKTYTEALFFIAFSLVFMSIAFAAGSHEGEISTSISLESASVTSPEPVTGALNLIQLPNLSQDVWQQIVSHFSPRYYTLLARHASGGFENVFNDERAKYLWNKKILTIRRYGQKKYRTIFTRRYDHFIWIKKYI